MDEFVKRLVIVCAFTCVEPTKVHAQSVLGGDQSLKSYKKLEIELAATGDAQTKAAALVVLALRDPSISLSKSASEYACERNAMRSAVSLEQPMLSKILSRCGTFLFDKERFDEARRVFSELSNDKAYQEFSLLQIGWTYMNQKRFDLAFNAFLDGINNASDGPLRASLIRDLMRAWTEGAGISEPSTQILSELAQKTALYGDLLAGFKRSLSTALNKPGVGKSLTSKKGTKPALRALMLDAITEHPNFLARKSCDILPWLGTKEDLEDLSKRSATRLRVLDRLQTCKIKNPSNTVQVALISALSKFTLQGDESLLLSDLYVAQSQNFEACQTILPEFYKEKTTRLLDRLAYCLEFETMQSMSVHHEAWVKIAIEALAQNRDLVSGQRVLAIQRSKSMRSKTTTDRVEFVQSMIPITNGFKDSASYFVWAEILAEVKDVPALFGLADQVTKALLNDPNTPKAAADIPLILVLGKRDYFVIWERFSDFERLVAKKSIPSSFVAEMCEASLVKSLESDAFREHLEKNAHALAKQISSVAKNILENSRFSTPTACKASLVFSSLDSFKSSVTAIAAHRFPPAGPRLIRTLDRFLGQIEKLRKEEQKLAARSQLLGKWAAIERSRLILNRIEAIKGVQIPSSFDASGKELWRQEIDSLQSQLQELTLEGAT